MGGVTGGKNVWGERMSSVQASSPTGVSHKMYIWGVSGERTARGLGWEKEPCPHPNPVAALYSLCSHPHLRPQIGVLAC